jgi:hemin uptake protein HemP
MQRVSAEPSDPGAPGRPGPRRIESDSLLLSEREIVIVHRGQEYHLRLTKSDKLILTK